MNIETLNLLSRTKLTMHPDPWSVPSASSPFQTHLACPSSNWRWCRREPDMGQVWVKTITKLSSFCTFANRALLIRSFSFLSAAFLTIFHQNVFRIQIFWNVREGPLSSPNVSNQPGKWLEICKEVLLLCFKKTSVHIKSENFVIIPNHTKPCQP